MAIKRFYLFTGKGGVGKTLCSLAFARQLIDNGHKVLFIDFETMAHHSFCQQLAIPQEHLDVFKNFERYIGPKLRSSTLARWIVGNEFCKSLINIIPGMSYLISLGHLLSLLNEDPQLTIVSDCPSSGHALTMLESLNNYRQIFHSGALFKDIEVMQDFLSTPGNLRIFICHLPSQLSLSEGKELKDHLQKLAFDDVQMILNSSLSLAVEGQSEQLPLYLRERVQLERKLQQRYCSGWPVQIPYLSSLDDLAKIKMISPYFTGATA